MLVLYLCDKRACDRCNPECKYTEDIRHARNFELGAGKNVYTEKGGDNYDAAAEGNEDKPL